MPKEHVEAPKGLLHPGPAEVSMMRYTPSEQFRPFVEHYWTVWLHLGPAVSTLEELTYPSVQVVVECDAGEASSLAVGVITARFVKRLTGNGHIFGMKFRPSGFHALVGASLSSYTDRRRPIGDLFGIEANKLERRVLHARDDAAMIAAAEEFLEAVVPSALTPGESVVNQMVDWIAIHPDVSQVWAVAEQFGLNTRTLQRVFRECLGVPPKWVIQRFRLLEAVEALPVYQAGEVGSLAAELGYFDQSHFVRDFKATVGTTPSEYARKSSQKT